MANKRSKLQNLLGLFAPSPTSIVFTIFLPIATIVLYQFDSIKHFLLLPDNLGILRGIARGADKFLVSTLGESRTDVIVVGAFWAIVGLGVYLFLRGLARYISELDDSIEVRRYVWPKGADRTKPLRVTIERTAFRAVALVGLMVVVFGPLARTLRGPVFVDFLGANVALQYAVWFVAGFLLWHMVLILLRLLALRPRLVGEL